MKHSLLALLSLSLAVSAIKIPVRQVKRSSNVARSTGQMIAITDTENLMYIANVTIDGEPYPLQLDTGSSDLWINTPATVPGKETHVTVNLTYGIGFAYGPVATAPVSFAGYDVPSQAYLAAQQVDNPILNLNASGIIGCSFDSLSGIDSAVNASGGSWGRSLLYNIFAQNFSEPNMISLSLNRDRTQPDQGGAASNTGTPGMLTIGEYDPQYAGVANTAHISTFPQKNPSRWSVLVDRIIANGKGLSVSSSVTDAPHNKAVALLDSGTTLVYAPKNIVTAIYGSIDGAEYSQQLGKWVLPCDAEVDVSIVIDNRQFDIHPLDTVQSVSDDGQTCAGSWIPGDLGVGVDYIFGDAALRSIYTVFDFGDYDSNHKMGDPYVQLWSVVNGSDASREFHNVRGGIGHDTFLSNNGVNDANSSSTPSGAGSTDSSDVSDLRSKVDRIYKWAPIALGVIGFNILVLLGLVIATIVGCRRNGRSVAPSGSFVPLPLGAGSHDYRPVSLQETSKYQPRYSD